MSTRRVVNTPPAHAALQDYASGKFTAELNEIRAGQYEIVITTRPPISGGWQICCM